MRRRELIILVGSAAAWPLTGRAQVSITGRDARNDVADAVTPLATTTSAYPDGSAGAPVGPVQYPHLLDLSANTQTFGVRYVTRPPWKVAGVDYYVGIDRTAYPTDGNLKNPANRNNYPPEWISKGWIDVPSLANQRLNVIGSITRLTLDGYDFSLDGGWAITCRAGASLTIRNCKFVIGSNTNIPFSTTTSYGGNVTIENCSFDGSGSNSANRAISYSATGGQLTVQRCYIFNQTQHGIELVGSIGSPTIRWNVFRDMGMAAGSHPDPWYIYSANIDGGQFSSNTIIETQNVNAGNWGMVLSNDPGAPFNVTNCSASFNTVITQGGPKKTASYMFGLVQTAGSGTFNNNTMGNNYFDPTGAAFGIYYPPTLPNTFGTNSSFSNNINMVSGQVARPPMLRR